MMFRQGKHYDLCNLNVEQQILPKAGLVFRLSYENHFWLVSYCPCADFG